MNRVLSYASPAHVAADSDIIPMRNRGIVIGGPLDGDLLSEEEFFRQPERKYTRYNSTFKYSKYKFVWIWSGL